jgi:hypothetical protein
MPAFGPGLPPGLMPSFEMSMTCIEIIPFINSLIGCFIGNMATPGLK